MKKNVTFFTKSYRICFLPLTKSIQILGVFILFLYSIPAIGQFAPTSFGNTISNENYQVSFTIGELVVANTINDQTSVFSGLIQPFSDIDVAIDEVLTYNIDLTPNPTSAYLEITQRETNFTEYEIYSTNGVLVMNGKFLEKIEGLDFLPSGIYIIKLVNATQIYSSLFSKI